MTSEQVKEFESDWDFLYNPRIKEEFIDLAKI